MKPIKKVFIIIAICCIVAGSIAASFAAAALLNGGEGVRTEISEKKTVNITEPFQNIKINEIIHDVEVLPSADGSCRVEYYDIDKFFHSISVDNGTLSISYSDQRKWFDFFGMSLSGNLVLRLYLPEESYRSLKIKGLSSDINVSPDFNFGEAEIECGSGSLKFSGCVEGSLSADSTSGDIYLENLSCGELSARSSSGNVILSDLRAEELSAGASSGNVKISSAAVSGKISLSTTSGDIKLDNSSASSLYAESSSGDIDCLDTCSSGAFELETTSGNIFLSAVDGGEMKLKSSSGNITGTLLSVKNFVTRSSSGNVRVSDSDSSAAACTITTSSGNIAIDIIKS